VQIPGSNKCLGLTTVRPSSQAVVEGRDIIRRGLKWEIDNRVSVQFFKDPWVGSSPLNFWLNVVPQNTIDADIKVKEFISLSRQ